MSDTALPDLIHRLGIALFEEVPDGAFIPISPAPEWFRRLCPAASPGKRADLVQHFPFLESFLPDAEAHWSSGGDDQLRSGLCAEVDESGREYHYEISALCIGQRRFLLFGRRKDYDEIREILQKARDNLLDYELLERTQRALESSRNELRRARDAAEAATRAKSAFLAHMSHEIRTPMNAILGLTGLVLNSSLETKQKELLEIVRNSGETLLTILNDILDFSKIESGKLEFERQPFELRRCMEDSLDLFAVKAAEKKLELSGYISPDLPAWVVGDVTRLRQIVVNLLGNAIKFTAAGEVSLTVGAQPREPAGWELQVAVMDTGIGIPPDRKDRLFQSFSQIDATVTRKYGGTGLGLAICRNLVELMGGQIGVESEPGRGSTFEFKVPIGASSDPDPADLSGSQPWLEGKRAWLVGSTETSRRFLREQLEQWGMSVEAARSAAQARSWQAEGRSCDVSIVDPAGFEAPADLFQGLQYPRIELVPGGTLHSSRDSSPGTVLLTKPIKRAQLHAVLATVLNSAAAVAENTPLRDRPAEPGKSSLRILLADDNAVNQRVGQLILESIGYRADIAANGVEVLQALRRQPYDVVLMDLHMPEMDGCEASRRIRREFPPERQPRIVALTAGVLEEDRNRSTEAGMDAFISKPIRSAELTEALEGSSRRSDPDGVSAGDARSEASTWQIEGFDPDVIASLRSMQKPGQPDLLAELFDVYRGMLPDQLAEIQRAVADGDRETLEQVAHRLRGSSANLGATAIASACATLETMAGSGPIQGIQEVLKQLESFVDRLLKISLPVSSSDRFPEGSGAEPPRIPRNKQG